MEVHKTPKKCIHYESRCAKIINNITELFAMEKQWRQEYLPISNSY